MFDPDQFHDPEFRTLVRAARAVIAERVHRGVATPPERLAVAALDEVPDEEDPAAVRAWTPVAADGESATVDLTVRENEEVNPETLVLDAEVAGEAAKGSETRTSPGILSLAIEDTTPRLVRAKSEEDIHAAPMAAKDAVMGDHGLNPGEDFELMGSDLFDAAADVTVS